MLTLRAPKYALTVLFVLSALCVSLLHGFTTIQVSPMLLVACIFVLGMPHGALDIYYAKQALALQRWQTWSQFLAAYSLLAIGIYSLWLWLPTVSLLAFLCISAYHFADDLSPPAPWPLKLSQGLQAVSLPALWHADSLYPLFQQVSMSRHIGAIILWLHSLAVVALVVGCVTIVMALWRTPQRVSFTALLEWAATALLMLVTPPLLAFTLYFCLLHSPRHLGRTAVFLHDSPRLFYRWPVLVACLAVALVGGWLFSHLPPSSTDQRLVAVIFPLLAALTYPHVWLLQHARFSHRHTPSHA